MAKAREQRVGRCGASEAESTSTESQAAVMQIVKQTIARQTENKMRGFNVEQNVVHNSAIADADVADPGQHSGGDRPQ